MLNKFLSLHKLTINPLITLPTVSSGYSKLHCQSGARSVDSQKSGVVKRSGERELQKNDGAEREAGGRGAATERGAGVTEIGWSAERVFRRPHELDACYSVLCLWCRVFDVWHVGFIVRLVLVTVHYPPACNKQVG